MFKLVIQDDEGKTTVVPLIRDEITIGRKEGNTIRLTERNVSRRHAKIVRTNGEVQIEDLGSYNGIRVNNARIAERVSLRISDQVQIGDYKLYLKAEGVEQVDDARTMPIERIDSGLPTDVMPAVAQGAPGAPAATPQPQPIPGTPPPNRSPVAVADTDPAGRPVATASQVAALNAPATYGKLVVLSSNLAGKEFDLTRPQMIVGRTDENDMVINHRSISRNHAKITRDLETGRYTISDLQSSNGVRVNGQDYGKVELRRGDTVDLGHVRLRFVEPGEDFVFARDAVITDVPESGGKKGLLVAIILGILVLGGVGAFFVLNKKGNEPTARTDNGDNGGKKGSNDVVATNNGGDNGGSEVAVNPVTTNNGGSDNGSAETMVKPPTGDIGAQLKIDCQSAQADAKWTELSTCSEKLKKYDPDAAKKYGATARGELQNQATYENRIKGEKDFGKAKKALESIPEDSHYHQDAAAKVDELKNTATSLAVSKAQAMKNKGQCDQIAKLAAETKRDIGADAGDLVANEKSGCVEAGGNTGTTTVAQKDCSSKLLDGTKACKNQFCSANPNDAKCKPETPNVTAPANCDSDALKDKGMENVNMGQHAAALAQFEASLRCKNDSYVLALAFMAACNAQNAAKAKAYYGKLAPAQQTKYKVMCIRNHIDLGQ